LPPPDLISALAELGIVLLLAVVAILSHAIDRGGFLASVAVGYAVIFGGGWQWFLIVAAFFVLGVGFTWYKYEHKKKLGAAQEKGGARNWPNILANGGAAAAFALLELLRGGEVFPLLFLGAISAAASDTVATELGLLSRSPPRLITRIGRKVEPGTSGGVTALGFAGVLLASAVIGVLAFLLRVLAAPPLVVISAVVFGGVVGSVVDSLIGATFQRRGKCVVCGVNTESLQHCGQPTKVLAGVAFVDNNVVNFLATMSGAFAALLALTAYSI
jgi:uncharacterized protein (TIGR00297 family)